MAALLPDRELLARIVGFDTTSRNSNLPLVDFLCDYLDRPGVRLTRHGPADEPKANLIVELGPEPASNRRSGLVLSGHLDVVPAEEPEWTSDPFRLTEREGCYYARGSADMKGFVALAVNLAARLDPVDLTQSLVLVLTYDEEVGTLGAEYLAKTWPAERALPRRAVIGEPTELGVVRAHKGFLKMRFVVRGVSAHSAYPHLGQSAIEPAGHLIVALTRLRQQLDTERLPSSADFPEVPFASLNLGLASGGSAINVIPDRFVLEAGLRLLPGMDAHEMAQRLTTTAREALAGELCDVELTGVSPPMALPHDAPFLRSLCELLGQEPAEAVSYATDAGWLQSMGMECVLFGPGSIRVAHKPNEHLPREQFEQAGRVLEELVRSECARPQGIG